MILLLLDVQQLRGSDYHFIQLAPLVSVAWQGHDDVVDLVGPMHAEDWCSL